MNANKKIFNRDNYGVLYALDLNGSIVNIDKDRKVFIAPPPLRTGVEYQDVGKDMNLRNEVSTFYLEKLIKWLQEDAEFKPLKKHLKVIKSNKGQEIVYNLLRLFVRNGKANWYDLRDTYNYSIVKDYLRYKLKDE